MIYGVTNFREKAIKVLTLISVRCIIKTIKGKKGKIKMKLNLESIKDMPSYSKFTGTLHCKLTRGNSTLEQYNATIKFLGFKPVETNSDYTTYELGSNARVETLKRAFIQFVNSDYGNKYIIDND